MVGMRTSLRGCVRFLLKTGPILAEACEACLRKAILFWKPVRDPLPADLVMKAAQLSAFSGEREFLRSWKVQLQDRLAAHGLPESTDADSLIRECWEHIQRLIRLRQGLEAEPPFNEDLMDCRYVKDHPELTMRLNVLVSGERAVKSLLSSRNSAAAAEIGWLLPRILGAFHYLERNFHGNLCTRCMEVCSTRAVCIYGGQGGLDG